MSFWNGFEKQAVSAATLRAAAKAAKSKGDAAHGKFMGALGKSVKPGKSKASTGYYQKKLKNLDSEANKRMAQEKKFTRGAQTKEMKEKFRDSMLKVKTRKQRANAIGQNIRKAMGF